MNATRADGAGQAAPRDSSIARSLALVATLLALPGLIGWLFGIPWLVQPLATFAPARANGSLMIAVAGSALLTKLSGRRSAARALAVTSGLMALVGLGMGLTGRALPLDMWAAGRIAMPLTRELRAIPLSIGLLFVTNASVLLLLTARRMTQHTLMIAGGLASFQVAVAGVLLVAQLSGLVDGTSVQGFRAPLQGLLAALVLGIALLQRLTLHEQTAAGVPSAPPRWAPVLAGASAALVVLVLWQALAAREVSQARTRAVLTAMAIENAVQRQYRAVTGGVGRSAAYLTAAKSPQDAEWKEWMPRLVKETEGLVHLVWFDSTGSVLRSASARPLPDSVLLQIRAMMPRLRRVPLATTPEAVALRSVALTDGPWRLVLWTALRSPSFGSTVLVAIVDDVALVREFLGDVSADFEIRVLDGDRTVLHINRPADEAHEPAVRRVASASRFESPLQIGARELRLMVEQRGSATGSALPDVVLVLGLAVALLLAIALWLQRRIWEQASAEGMSRMQEALEGTTDGVWELDVQHGRMHRSPALLEYLRLEQPVLERGFASWIALVHPDDAPRVSAALDAHLRGDATAFECEYRLRAGDGSWHTLVDRGRVVERLPDGAPVRVLGISADVTERSLASAAREASERRFRAMFDTAYQVQLLLDLDGSILEANQAAGELAATSPDMLQGVAFWNAPWWNGDATMEARVQERFARARGGETQRFEVNLSNARDQPITVDFSLKPIPDAEQRVSQVLAEGRDLTIRKRAEESLREISALTTMGQLAARVAHEINNPLAGIQNAFLLIRGAIPADHPHYRFVGAIEREIARIAAVTRQLYETYRPDQMMATQSSVILAVSDAVSFLEQVNRGRQVRIVSDMSRAPSMVPVPDALLRQTLYNLVQNALDVSPMNGTITVSAAQEGDMCVLRVSDEGPGVPAAIRDRIFDPFFSTKDRTVRTGGMGIGLALVRQSVLAVGGRIEVRDRATGGTEFEVRLPMTPLDTGVLR